jgi:hypothetical protein
MNFGSQEIVPDQKTGGVGFAVQIEGLVSQETAMESILAILASLAGR